MARCVCPRGECRCKVVAGVGVQVEGVGSENQPFVVASVPRVYDVEFGPSSPPFYVNAEFQSEVGARTLFVVEVALGAHGVIVLPDGSSAYPVPGPGRGVGFPGVGRCEYVRPGVGDSWQRRGVDGCGADGDGHGMVSVHVCRSCDWCGRRLVGG